MSIGGWEHVSTHKVNGKTIDLHRSGSAWRATVDGKMASRQASESQAEAYESGVVHATGSRMARTPGTVQGEMALTKVSGMTPLSQSGKTESLLQPGTTMDVRYPMGSRKKSDEDEDD